MQQPLQRFWVHLIDHPHQVTLQAIEGFSLLERSSPDNSDHSGHVHTGGLKNYLLELRVGVELVEYLHVHLLLLICLFEKPDGDKDTLITRLQHKLEDSHLPLIKVIASNRL
mgnify:CR=1 FL=1